MYAADVITKDVFMANVGFSNLDQCLRLVKVLCSELRAGVASVIM